jgi:hypothetical protein
MRRRLPFILNRADAKRRRPRRQGKVSADRADDIEPNAWKNLIILATTASKGLLAGPAPGGLRQLDLRYIQGRCWRPAFLDSSFTSMEFRERLQRAAQRGHEARDAKVREDAARAMSEEECRRIHREYRQELNEHIESCLKQLADNFPGFRFEPVMSDKGWGAAVRRDDLTMTHGRRDNLFSRLELVVSSHNQYHVLDIQAKGAVRNKENFTRSHYQKLKDADLDAFKNLIEQWTLDYAEQYAASEA